MAANELALSSETQNILKRELENLYHRRTAVVTLINSLENYDKTRTQPENRQK